MRHIISVLLGRVRISLLAMYVISGVACLYAATATSLYLAFKTEFYDVLDDVNRVLEHPAIKPLA